MSLSTSLRCPPLGYSGQEKTDWTERSQPQGEHRCIASWGELSSQPLHSVREAESWRAAGEAEENGHIPGLRKAPGMGCWVRVFGKWAIVKWFLLFSCSVVSDSVRPHVLQHNRLPCPSSSSGICSNSCPLSQWCHPTISSSVIPFFSCLQSFPASGSFPMTWLFPSGGQSIGASASASSFQ